MADDAALQRELDSRAKEAKSFYNNYRIGKNDSKAIHYASLGGDFKRGEVVPRMGRGGVNWDIHRSYFDRQANRLGITPAQARQASAIGRTTRSGKKREAAIRRFQDPSGQKESSYQASRNQARRNVASATQRAKINQEKTEQIKNPSNRFSNNNVIFRGNQAIDPKSEEGQQIEAILDRQRITKAANAEQSKMFWNMRNASTATEAMQIRQEAMKVNPTVGTFNYIVDNKTGKVKSDSLSGVLGVAQTTKQDKDGFLSEGISSVFRTNKRGIPQSEIMPRQWLTDSGKSIGSITERSVNTPVQVYKTAPREYMLPSTMGMFGGVPNSGKLSFSDAKELGYMDNTQKAFDFLPTPIEKPLKPSESIYNAFIKSSSNTMAGFTNLYEYGRSGFMSLVDPPKKGQIKVGRQPKLKSFYSTPVTNVESALWGSAIGTFTQKDYWPSGQGEKNFKKELAQVGRNFERNPWSAGASTILEGALYAPGAIPKTISSVFTGTIKATTKGSGKKGGSGMSGSYSPGLPYKTYGANKKIDYNKLFPGTSFSSNTVGLGSGKPVGSFTSKAIGLGQGKPVKAKSAAKITTELDTWFTTVPRKSTGRGSGYYFGKSSSKYIDEFPGFTPTFGSGKINLSNAVVVSPKSPKGKKLTPGERKKVGGVVNQFLNIHVRGSEIGRATHGSVIDMIRVDDIKNLSFGTGRRLKDIATVKSAKDKRFFEAGDTIFTTRGTIGRTRFFENNVFFGEKLTKISWSGKDAGIGSLKSTKKGKSKGGFSPGGGSRPGFREVSSGSMKLIVGTPQKQKSLFKAYPLSLGSGTRTFGKQLVKQKTKQKQLPQLLSQDIVFKKQQSQLPIMAQGFKQKKGLKLSDALLPGVRQVSKIKSKTVKPTKSRGLRFVTPTWTRGQRQTPKTVLIPPMFTGLGIFGEGGGRGKPIQTSGKRSRKVYSSTAISSDINIKVLPGQFLRVSRDRSAFDQLDYVESATMASLGVPVKPKRRKKSVPKKKSKVRKRKRSNR